MKTNEIPWTPISELTETYDCWSPEEVETLTHRIVTIEDEQNEKGNKVHGVLIERLDFPKMRRVTLLFFKLEENTSLTLREPFSYEWITIK